MAQPPFGSHLRSRAVQQALQGLAETAQQAQQASVGSSPYKRPSGSAFGDPHVQQALQGLAETAQQGSSDVRFRRPTGSSLGTADAQSALGGLGKIVKDEQEHPQVRPAPGKTDRRHPAKDGSLAERAAEFAGQIQMENKALYAAHNALCGGELSPAMLARWDQPRYQTGCELLLNMVPMPQGGITKRPGMVSMGAGGSGRARLFPFVFSAGESRVLELVSTSSGSTITLWFPDGSHSATGLALPWTASAIPNVKMAQSADVLYCVHPSYRPLKIMRYSDSTWRWEYVRWTPSIAAPSISGVEMTGESSGDQTTYRYVATVVDAETGEESVQSAEASVQGYALSQTYYASITVAAVSGASEYRIYKYRGGVYGYIGSITEGTTFEDRNIEPDTADTPPRIQNPFDGAGNYPSVVFFHQQRLGFASSNNQPLTVWLSQAGNFESMAASIPPADDDAIEATLAATQANRILWCQSDRTSLAIGTEGGEWILTGTDGAAVTPSDLAFQPQTYHGSEPGLPVLRAGSGLVYMQRGGRVVREFGYSFQADRYESNDLSLLARHVLKASPVVSWAWQGEPYGIIWCVLANGKVAGLTYMREHDVIGWHRHETAGTVEDVVAIPGSDGSTQVWMHVVRNGTRYVERLAPFFEGGGASGAVHVDGAGRATFNARCIPSLPETQVQNGTTFLKVRKINAVKARCIHSKGFKARVGSSAQFSVPARGSGYVEGHVDWAVPLASGWRENDRLELIFDGADPATVLGIVTTVEIAEEGGGQK